MAIPLVLLPGLLNDAALWRQQIDSLGSMASPWVAPLTGADSIAGMAASVLGQAPPSFALAGLSMGGYVAFEIMRQAPGRVQRLALLDTSARPDPEETRQRRLVLMQMARDGQFEQIPPQQLTLAVAPQHQTDRHIAGTFLGMAARTGPEAYIRQQTAIMNRVDSRPSLAAIRVPTLVVCGRQDQLTPPAVMEEIAAGISGARYVPVDDSGHMTPLEQPQAVSALLRYWLQA